MPQPRSHRRASPGTRIARLLALGLLVVVTAGCGRSPRVGPGSLAQAKTRVIGLVNATETVIRSRVAFVPVQHADELPCKKTFLGYTVGSTGTRRAEVPVEISVNAAAGSSGGASDGASLLPAIERYWRARGYTIDRSGMSDRQFPKLRARVGADELLVATGYVGLPQLNLYAVSACVRR